MIRKDELIKKIQKIETEINREDFIKELQNIFIGMKEVSRGFLKIAQSAEKIKKKKYYRELGYKTFEQFCKDIIGLTRKTVYLYLRIGDALKKYPNLFNEEFVIRLGSAKMEKIIIGINKIEDSSTQKTRRIKKIKMILDKVDLHMSLGEIDDLVNKYT